MEIMKKNEIDIAEIANKIRQEKGIDAILLFGSAARGKSGPLSDTDICVITNKLADKRAILGNASKSVDTSIFWDLPIHIRYRVIKEGVPLFIGNKKAFHTANVSTVLSYIDFRHILDRHFHLTLN